MFGNQLHGGTIPDVKEYAAAMAVSIASDDCIVRDKEFSVRYGIVKPSFCKSVNIWAKEAAWARRMSILGSRLRQLVYTRVHCLMETSRCDEFEIELTVESGEFNVDESWNGKAVLKHRGQHQASSEH